MDFLVLLVSEKHLCSTWPTCKLFPLLFCDFFSSRENLSLLTVGGNAAPVLGTGGMLMKGSYKFDLDEPFTC